MTAEEKDAAIRPLIALAPDTIARQLGANVTEVARMVVSLRRTMQPPSIAPSVIPPLAPAPAAPVATVKPVGAVQLTALERTILDLKHQGLSSAQIATKVPGHLSKNAIVGYVHRMRQRGVDIPLSRQSPKTSTKSQGLKPSRDPRAAVKPAPVAKTKQNLHAGNIARKKESRAFDPGAIIITRAAAFDPIPGFEPVPFGSAGCKFPVDGLHGRGLLACGRPQDKRYRESEPYCADHARLAYAPASDRQIKSLKSAERIH